MLAIVAFAPNIVRAYVKAGTGANAISGHYSIVPLNFDFTLGAGFFEGKNGAPQLPSPSGVYYILLKGQAKFASGPALPIRLAKSDPNIQTFCFVGSGFGPGGSAIGYFKDEQNPQLNGFYPNYYCGLPDVAGSWSSNVGGDVRNSSSTPGNVWMVSFRNENRQGYGGDIIGNYFQGPVLSGTLGQSVTIKEVAKSNSIETSTRSITYTFGVGPSPSPNPDLGPTRGNNPWQTAGDPISPVTGAFNTSHVDLHVAGPLPIDVQRSYSSSSTANNELGSGWLSGYPSYLVPSSDLSTIQAADPGGSIVLFRLQGTTNVWLPLAADNPQLGNVAGGASNLLNSKIIQTVAGRYEWRLPDGSVRVYVLSQYPIPASTRQRPYLASWSDNRGNALTFSYGTVSSANDFGQINLIQSSSGPSVSFMYSAAGLITSATASDGRSVSYNYTLSGAYTLPADLTEVKLPDGQSIDYQYGTDSTGESNHLLVQETKPEGRILTNIYDGLGRVFQQSMTVDPGQPGVPIVTSTFDYSMPGQTTVSDAYGKSTVYQYSGQFVTKITDPLGRTNTKTWYPPTVVPAGGTYTPVGGYWNSLQSVTDERGLITTYEYDVLGNVNQTQVAGDLVGTPTASNETATTTAVYNNLNLPVTVTDPSGITTAFSYADVNYPYLPTLITTSKAGATLRTDKLEYIAQQDAINPAIISKGLLFRKTVAFGSPDQSITEYSYNSAGFMTQQKVYTGTSDPNVITNFLYNNRGELITITDADNRSTLYTYDAMSRPLTKTVKDENGNVLGVWTTTYTGNGDPASITGPRTGTPDSVQRFYDGAGRMSEEVTARSQAKADGSGVEAATSALASYVHDLFGNLKLATDANGNDTTFNYDAMGQLLSKTTAGLRTESFQYEAGGNVSQYTNPLGGVTKKFYTSTGKLRRQENPDGSVLQWLYYSDGRLQQEILRNGSYWATTYDDVNHKITRTLTRANGAVLATELSVFDLRGNLISRTDPEGFVNANSYDGLNRIKVATGPAAIVGSAQQTTSMIYGTSAKSVTTSNGSGEKIVSTSDGLGRPVQVQVSAANGASVHQTGYAYSPDHNAVTVTQGSGASAISQTTFTDTTNRAVLVVSGDGSFTQTVYDLKSNVLSTTDALKQATSYTYNAFDQAVTQTLPDGVVTTFSYDAMGHMLTRGMAGGTLNHEQTFDNAGRQITERLYAGATSTRQFSYSYYPAGNLWAGLLKTVTAPRDTVTTTYDDFLRPQTVTTTGALPETNSTTTYAYDRRGLATAINQSSVNAAAGPATQISRTFDGYGQKLNETLTVAGQTYSNVTQAWNTAGRRASLNESSSTLPAPLFAYQYQADGALTQVTANTQSYNFTYADNGLLSGRTNPFRTVSIDARDALGRILKETTSVNGAVAMVESMTWRDNSTLDAYNVNRSGTGAWNESRAYQYNSRGQLTSEGFSPAVGLAQTLTYAFDGSTTGLGVRTDAKIGLGGPAAWESKAAVIDTLSRVTQDQLNATSRVVPASGVALGADHVDVLVDGVARGRALHLGSADPVGAWSMTLSLAPGAHTLTTNAVHPSGQFTATASSTFTVASGTGPFDQTGYVTNAYDADGTVISRTWANGVAQILTRDAFGRLIRVAQRDGTNTGYDWTAVYDGMGRRLKTAQQIVTAGVASGTPTVTTSIFDPQVEFLEIGVAVNGAKAWKVYGPDLNGKFGGLQGTGGLEATIVDSGAVTKGVINDQFGNGVGSVSGSTVTWFATRVGGYGPLPGTAAETLTDITRVAEATAWRSRRIDPTGFYNLGARYFESTSGRFLSADPMGHRVSPSLYDFCGGDPVNFFDPDGRCRDGRLTPDGQESFARAAGIMDSLSRGLIAIMGMLAQGGVDNPYTYGYNIDAHDAVSEATAYQMQAASNFATHLYGISADNYDRKMADGGTDLIFAGLGLASLAENLALRLAESAAGNPLRAANIGNKVHYDLLNGGEGAELPSKLQAEFPDTEFRFARRGQLGADAEVIGGTHPSEYPGSSWKPGNDFGDFKPDTPNGNRTFTRETRNGKLPVNTQMLLYNPQTGEPVW